MLIIQFLLISKRKAREIERFKISIQFINCSRFHFKIFKKEQKKKKRKELREKKSNKKKS